MSIPLFGCEAHGGTIVTLDDELVTSDLASEAGSGGNDFTPYILSNPFELDEFGEFSKFRRATQMVHVNGSCDVALTPYRDGAPTGQTIDRELEPGTNPLVEAPFDSAGSLHQLHIELSDFDAPVELGKSRQWLIARRSSR